MFKITNIDNSMKNPFLVSNSGDSVLPKFSLPTPLFQLLVKDAFYENFHSQFHLYFLTDRRWMDRDYKIRKDAA